jgi:hypothetical protein
VTHPALLTPFPLVRDLTPEQVPAARYPFDIAHRLFVVEGLCGEPDPHAQWMTPIWMDDYQAALARFERQLELAVSSQPTKLHSRRDEATRWVEDTWRISIEHTYTPEGYPLRCYVLGGPEYVGGILHDVEGKRWAPMIHNPRALAAYRKQPRPAFVIG